MKYALVTGACINTGVDIVKKFLSEGYGVVFTGRRIEAVKEAGYTKVVLRPLMVVAGDHANNDMAGDEEGSWYYGFVNGGEFEVEGADAPVDTGDGFGADS